MHNKATINWLSQGIGSAKVIAQFTDSDITALTELWEKTLDGREKDLLKNILNKLLTKGVAFLEIENVEYYGGDTWKFMRNSNATKASTSSQQAKQQRQNRKALISKG
jgi:hypothetical protein